ncbi:DarT ssDNA thymidine ADP-ribosyltransferase family protein [Butyrivibrio fibrisolvens]|uniref:DarT ssDNA thymidine ADP-ribosyltransferase family protein n=1 Tax=Butyrivibrio fibrisolvens TaxID=831 RepID=UPI000407124D|nr:DarT ssDNA thymidine ADP-ribosyltransferase family protein [Butyrivibrio fibrisolvens]
MGIDNAKNGRLLYHLTSVDNLDSIFENGLLPRKCIRENGIGFRDIADPGIIDKRKSLGLDKYTPFHFHPYTAFDYAVKYSGNATRMVYICVDREFARYNKFLVLPQHPLSSDQIELFSFDEGMNKIDWDTMMEVGRDDQYAKEVKMAESLTDLIIPANQFKCLYVANEEMKQFVTYKLKEYGIELPPPYVNVKAEWFDNYD